MSAEQRGAESAFGEFLRTRHDHREGLTARQQLWTAFEAGANWALASYTQAEANAELLAAALKAEAVIARGKWLDTSPDPEAVALRELRAAIARAQS